MKQFILLTLFLINLYADCKITIPNTTIYGVRSSDGTSCNTIYGVIDNTTHKIYSRSFDNPWSSGVTCTFHGYRDKKVGINSICYDSNAQPIHYSDDFYLDMENYILHPESSDNPYTEVDESIQNDITCDSICPDNGPELLKDGFCTCERQCSEVLNMTSIDGKCIKPNCDVQVPEGWISADTSLCSNFDTHVYVGSNLINPNDQFCEPTCFLLLKQDNNYFNNTVDGSEFLNSYIDYNEEIKILNNLIENQDNYPQYDTVSYYFDGNDIIDTNDSDFTQIQNEIYNNYNQSTNQQLTQQYATMPDNFSSNLGTLTSAPASGGGSGGNSLSDEMKNLGNSVNNNSDVTKTNTDSINQLNDSVSGLKDAITGATESDINYAEEAMNSIVLDFSNIDLGVNTNNCGSIQPVTFTLSNGETYSLLSQEFLDTLPMDLIKKMILFSFVLSGVVFALRSS